MYFPGSVKRSYIQSLVNESLSWCLTNRQTRPSSFTISSPFIYEWAVRCVSWVLCSPSVTTVQLVNGCEFGPGKGERAAGVHRGTKGILGGTASGGVQQRNPGSGLPQRPQFWPAGSI